MAAIGSTEIATDAWERRGLRRRNGREIRSDKCLFGGTNAVLWTGSELEIIEETEGDLAELPHHCGLILSSARVMPPLAKPDTIRAVCERVRGYSVRV